MPNLSNDEKATELARAYDHITQADIKIDDYSLRYPFFTIEISYQTMPEKQNEIAHTLAITLPEILKKFTTIEHFYTTLSANFIDLISVYKFASTIPFAEIISISEKIINPNNTQTEIPIKKFLVQRLTELLTTKFQSNGITEELQQTALRMLEICKHSASNICSNEQTDFFSRLQLSTITLANTTTTLSSFDNPVTTTNATISNADTYSTPSELKPNYPMSVELTNTTAASTLANNQTTLNNELPTSLTPTNTSKLPPKLISGAIVGFTMGVKDVVLDRLRHVCVKKAESKKCSRSAINTIKIAFSFLNAVSTAALPALYAYIANTMQDLDEAEDAITASQVVISSLSFFVLDGTLTTISAFLPENSNYKKALGYIKYPLAFSLPIATAKNIAESAIVTSISSVMGVGGRFISDHLLNSRKPHQETGLPPFDTNLSEDVFSYTDSLNSSNTSDRSSTSSDSSSKSLYFIKEEKLNEIKKGLTSIMVNLSNLHYIYVKDNAFLIQTKEKLPENIPNKTINEINLKIGLVEKSIEQLNLYKTRLDDNHVAACIAFASDSELVTNKSVHGLHALLKEIRRILKELNSNLDKINGVQELPYAIQTPINSIRNDSESITSLITTLITGYDIICTGVKAEKKSKACSFFSKNSPSSSMNDDSSTNEEPIYIEMSFKR